MGVLGQSKLSIRFPSGPFVLDELTLQQMAVVGRICTSMSAYEYSCDDFIFSVVEHYPEFVKIHHLDPAFNNDEKRRAFVVKALEGLEVLKEMRDAQGNVDAVAIGSTMEQLWHHRINLTHGRLTGSRRKNGSVELHFVRWRKADNEKRTYHHVSFSYDQPLLEVVLERASYLQTMLIEAKQRVIGGTH